MGEEVKGKNYIETKYRRERGKAGGKNEGKGNGEHKQEKDEREGNMRNKYKKGRERWKGDRAAGSKRTA